MSMLAWSHSPQCCPCCWPCEVCLPVFTIDTGGTVPDLDGDWETCRTTALADWAEPSDTAKRKTSEWGSGYFATQVQEPYTNCKWQAAQYCVDDPAGNRGRSWVVDLYFNDNGTVTTLTDVVQDWRCTCNGPAFEWTVDGEIPGCFSAPSCECSAGTCLQATIPAYDFYIGAAHYVYAGGTIQMPSYSASPVQTWLSFDGTTRVKCDTDGALGCAAGQFQLSFGGVKWCCDTCTGTFVWLPLGGETGTTPGDATVIECP